MQMLGPQSWVSRPVHCVTEYTEVDIIEEDWVKGVVRSSLTENVELEISAIRTQEELGQ